MSFEHTLNVIATTAAVIAAIGTIASLNDQARARLIAWTRQAGRWLWVAFVIAALSNSIAGIVLFGVQAGLPTRGDVLGLVLHLFNLFFVLGMTLFDAVSRLKERTTQPATSEPASVTGVGGYQALRSPDRERRDCVAGFK